jgi:hypothetical protein
MPLPVACEYCNPEGGYWVIAPYSEGGGMRRCDCERGQALAAQDEMRKLPPIADVEPQISKESATLGVSMLATMKFFPSEEGARMLIGDELRSMCADDSQVLWICRRMARMFTEWPGLPPMRALFWSKFVPIDRVAARDEASIFPDGVLPEVPDERQEYRSLPAGSNDAQLDAAIRKLADLKRLPAGRPKPERLN